MLQSLLQPPSGVVLLPWSLLCYSFIQESESEGLKNTKLSHLSAQLDKDKKRAECLKELCRENTVLLQQQTRLYLCVRRFYFNYLFVTCT